MKTSYAPRIPLTLGQTSTANRLRLAVPAEYWLKRTLVALQGGWLSPFAAPVTIACHGPTIVGRGQSTAQAEDRPVNRIVGAFPISAGLACWRVGHCDRLLLASSNSSRFSTSRQTPAASCAPSAFNLSIAIDACRNAAGPCSRSIASAQPQSSASRLRAISAPLFCGRERDVLIEKRTARHVQWHFRAGTGHEEPSDR